MTSRRRGPTPEEAEAIAAQGLAFLAEEGQRFARFLALTGLQVNDVGARAGSAELLGAVLEHLAGDESLLLVFAASARVAPETVAEALAVLQGGAPPHEG
jgi:hypothetical protein